jgi:hypothetical protein
MTWGISPISSVCKGRSCAAARGLSLIIRQLSLVIEDETAILSGAVAQGGVSGSGERSLPMSDSGTMMH